MNKFAITSFAVVLLGSSAALAQPYGYQPYVAPGNACPLPNVGLIIDPASGQTVTEAQYQARYPWTNTSTWTYDCGSNLWTDHTAQPGQAYAPQAQYSERDRGRDGDRARGRDDRDRDNRDRDDH